MITLIALILIFILEYTAIIHNIDGKTLCLAIFSMSGLGGYNLHKFIAKRKEAKKNEKNT